MAEWDIIEKCWDKKYLYPIAESNNIPIPRTFFLDSISDLEKVSDRIKYPCILKPSTTIGFLEKLKANGRTLIIKDEKDLNAWKQRIILAGLGETPLILQEQIEGPPSNLYTITSYADKNSDIIAYSTGHKIRQYPPDAGTITAGGYRMNLRYMNWESSSSNLFIFTVFPILNLKKMKKMSHSN